MINRAGRETLIGDDAVLAVKIEDMEPLVGTSDGQRIMPKSA
jgi:hypothetical protein